MPTEKAYRIVGPRDPHDTTAVVILPGGKSVEVGSEFVGTQEQYDAVSVRFVVEAVKTVKPGPAPANEHLEKGGDE